MSFYKMTCSSKDEQFTAYVIQREDNVIEGVVQEGEHARYCIKGLMYGDHGAKDIIFLMISCSEEEKARCFLFEEEEKGYCSEHSVFHGFADWTKDWSVELFELPDDELKKCKISMRFKHKVLTMQGIGKELMAEYLQLKTFL